MNLDLRPLSIPELLDRSVSLYRRHLVLFVGIMAVPAALSLLVTLPASLAGFFNPARQDPSATPAFDDVAPFIVLFGGYLLAMTAYFVVYVLALGATSFGVWDLYQGRTPTIQDTYARVRPRALGLVALMLHVTLRLGLVSIGIPSIGTALSALLAAVIGPFALLFMFGGFIAGGVLFVVMALRYSLCVPALILEQLPASAAIRRSVTLTRGSLGRAFLIGMCATMITYASALLFQGPFMFGAMLAGPESTLALTLTILGTVLGTVGGALVAPVMIIGLVVLYFDARVRGEALDVQVLMGAVARADGPLDGAPSAATP